MKSIVVTSSEMSAAAESANFCDAVFRSKGSEVTKATLILLAKYIVSLENHFIYTSYNFM
jgi:hypothetical protein